MTPYDALVAAIRKSLDVTGAEINTVLASSRRSLGDLVADALTGKPEGVKRFCDECGGLLGVVTSRRVGGSQQQRVKCRQCGQTSWRVVSRASIQTRGTNCSS